MRLSNRLIYGLRALFDLAYHGGEKPRQIREISEREEIPLRFLEQILLDLRRAGLVESRRGPKGGYLLATEPEEITFAEVFEALGEIEASKEVARRAEDGVAAKSVPTFEGHMPGSCCHSAAVTDVICDEIMMDFRSMLRGLTLADMMARGEQMGVSRECYERFVYVI